MMIKLNLQLFGGRGASSKGASGGAAAKGELTDSQMREELDKHYADLNARLDAFMNNPKAQSMVTNEYGTVIERETQKHLVDWYLKEYNQNIKENGDGFEGAWDDDDSVSILYKDGTQINLLAGISDGTKKVKTTGIDSIIVDGSWGSTFSGKNVVAYNWKEQVAKNENYYKSVKSEYSDADDVRLEFYSNRR